MRAGPTADVRRVPAHASISANSEPAGAVTCLPPSAYATGAKE